jgi:hypothetical protein
MRKLTRRINDAKRRFDLINGVFEESKVAENLIEALKNEVREELDQIRYYYKTDLELINIIGVDCYCFGKDEIITNAEQIANYLTRTAYIIFLAVDENISIEALQKLKSAYITDIKNGFLRISSELYKEVLRHCEYHNLITSEKQDEIFNEARRILGLIK